MLLIQTDRDTLLKPLQAVTGIVERRHTLPILSNVLIEARQNQLSFLATDLEIQISTSAEGGKLAEYAVTAAAKKLHDILRALPDNVPVALEAQNNRLQVKAGKSRFNLQTLPAEDFPRLAEGAQTGARFSLPQRALRQLFLEVQYAMAQQDIRYYLNGLLLVVEEASAKAVATDGHRLAYASTSFEGSVPHQEVILPRKAVLELAKLMADVDEPVSVEILQNQVRFRFSNITLVSKVVDGKFPDYTRVIPENYQKHFVISRETLQQALQRAAILSNEKFRGVRFVLTENSLKTVCTNSEQEEAQEELEIEYRGDALDIGFNITYLLDVLNNLDAESVDLSFGDANSSVLVSVPGNPDFKYVVMPMRI
ncbi:MAG: DNA polymerase III subunit beta [Betaproteobacteria bacterium]|nr:DNA polymerase III subunit beta [Betaproteobacteria bacterium]